LITYVASKGLDKVWNIAKTNIRKYARNKQGFYPNTKRDGFYPKNK